MNEQATKPKIERRVYGSERGPFVLNANPTIKPPDPDAEIDEDAVAGRFDCPALVEKYGEKVTREKVLEMSRAYRSGAVSTMLYCQEGENGMSLAHIWFGANFELFRHSHPKYGDCLYTVIAGELAMGSRKLGPGSTFFVPNGQPYKYTAGPAGAEVLEFRPGGGVSGAPEVLVDERSMESIDKLIQDYRENAPLWRPPTRVGDVAFVARQLEAETSGD